MLDEGRLQRVQRVRRSASPSIVVISAPSCMTASVRQELMRRPSTSTVQAPHWPWSQPFLVPVRPDARAGRRAGSSRARARAAADAIDDDMNWNAFGNLPCVTSLMSCSLRRRLSRDVSRADEEAPLPPLANGLQLTIGRLVPCRELWRPRHSVSAWLRRKPPSAPRG